MQKIDLHNLLKSPPETYYRKNIINSDKSFLKNKLENTTNPNIQNINDMSNLLCSRTINPNDNYQDNYHKLNSIGTISNNTSVINRDKSYNQKDSLYNLYQENKIKNENYHKSKSLFKSKVSFTDSISNINSTKINKNTIKNIICNTLCKNFSSKILNSENKFNEKCESFIKGNKKSVKKSFDLFDENDPKNQLKNMMKNNTTNNFFMDKKKRSWTNRKKNNTINYTINNSINNINNNKVNIDDLNILSNKKQLGDIISKSVYETKPKNKNIKILFNYTNSANNLLINNNYNNNNNNLSSIINNNNKIEYLNIYPINTRVKIDSINSINSTNNNNNTNNNIDFCKRNKKMEKHNTKSYISSKFFSKVNSINSINNINNININNSNCREKFNELKKNYGIINNDEFNSTCSKLRKMKEKSRKGSFKNFLYNENMKKNGNFNNKSLMNFNSRKCSNNKNNDGKCDPMKRIELMKKYIDEELKVQCFGDGKEKESKFDSRINYDSVNNNK